MPLVTTGITLEGPYPKRTQPKEGNNTRCPFQAKFFFFKVKQKKEFTTQRQTLRIRIITKSLKKKNEGPGMNQEVGTNIDPEICICNNNPQGLSASFLPLSLPHAHRNLSLSHLYTEMCISKRYSTQTIFFLPSFLIYTEHCIEKDDPQGPDAQQVA